LETTMRGGRAACSVQRAAWRSPPVDGHHDARYGIWSSSSSRSPAGALFDGRDVFAPFKDSQSAASAISPLTPMAR
jgi:hypothetical protein